MKNVSIIKMFLALCGAFASLLIGCDSAGYAGNSHVTTEGMNLSWSPDSQWIVFPASTDGKAPELYALNVMDTLKGAGRDSWIHLSQGFENVIGRDELNAITYMHLAWSPDGGRIAFTAGDTVYTFDAACLESPATCADSLQAVIGDASAWLTLEWSPDSTSLLVESTITGPTVKTDKGVMADNLVILMRVVMADGSGRVVFTRQTPPRQRPDWVSYSFFSPAWSPDGKQILYSSGKAGESDLYLITFGGESVEQLTHTPDVEEYSPGWSPDGREILYAAVFEGKRDIYRQELDEGKQVCVTCKVRPSWKYSLLWLRGSPDGTRIAYGISGKPRLFQRALPIYLYLIAPDGSSQVPVIEKGFSGPPFWSPDGKYLAFAFRPHNPLKSLEADILLINADGSGLTDLTD